MKLEHIKEAEQRLDTSVAYIKRLNGEILVAQNQVTRWQKERNSIEEEVAELEVTDCTNRAPQNRRYNHGLMQILPISRLFEWFIQ
jgi:hypothetical protein